MRNSVVVAAFLLGLVVAIPIGVASFNIATNLTDSRWEYKTQHIQERLGDCEMRERLGVH